LADSFLLDHIPAYSTLISISKVSLKDFSKNANGLIPDLKMYEEGQYFNAYYPVTDTEQSPTKDKHGYYQVEKYIMGSLSNRIPIRVDEFVSEILELQDFKLQLPSDSNFEDDIDHDRIIEQEIQF
jgi:hypothetical protein